MTCVEDSPKSKAICGVTGPCVHNKLSYFDTTKAFLPDVVHDFLEGIFPFVLKSVLKAFQGDRIISTTKAVLIPWRVARNGNVSGTAVEKWTFFQYLPFLIGKTLGYGSSMLLPEK